jgi:membrane protein YdbS with pleckstrin-like domain
MATEELAGHSPDGRPADKPSWSKGRLVLAGALLLLMPGVMFAVWWFGGIDALLMGLVYVVVLILVAFPVWYAGLMRYKEHGDASDIVRHTLSSERFGPTSRPH